MTPDELKRLDARCRIARRDAVIDKQPLPETLLWDVEKSQFGKREINSMAPLSEKCFYALAEDIKPTPKTVEAREWDAYVDNQAKIWSIEEAEDLDEGIDWIQHFKLKRIRVREVVDTPKPKERREWDAWIGPFGFLYSEDQASKLDESVKKCLQPIRFRKIGDEPKLNHGMEWKAWVHDGTKAAVLEEDWPKIMQPSIYPTELGFRKATLVEKEGE